jgi:signal transduction histidine kinase
MSHEFRTPLGHILGFSQILQDTLEDLTEKQVHYIENIQSAASGLLGLFENILQFSILKSGEAHVKPATFTPASLLDRCLESYQSPAALKSITLSQECSEPDRPVTADPEICRKALSCLLDNAVKFTPDEGTVTVSAGVRPAPDLPPGAESGDLAETIADGWLHIAVADSGPGIPQEDQERIFGLFEQGDASLTRHHQGTGLGLALARSLAKVHGGTLVIDSRPDEGSTFTLIVPLAAS